MILFLAKKMYFFVLAIITSFIGINSAFYLNNIAPPSVKATTCNPRSAYAEVVVVVDSSAATGLANFMKVNVDICVNYKMICLFKII